MNRFFEYGIACALDDPPQSAPITLRGDIEQVAKAALELGYDGIELQMCDPQKYNWRRLSQVAHQMGFRYYAIATGRELGVNGLSLISDDSGIRRAAIDRLKLHIDLGAAIGAMVIIGTMRSRILDPSRYQHYEDYHTEALLELSDYAQGKGVPLLVENILSAISNYLNTMAQVTDYLDRLGRDNIGVHLDTYSMNAEENDIYGAVLHAAHNLKYVHFSDTGRYYPGGGGIDFKAFMKALLLAGYDGPIVTECIPYPTQHACAERGIRYLRALETCVEIERSIVREKAEPKGDALYL